MINLNNLSLYDLYGYGVSWFINIGLASAIERGTTLVLGSLI